MTPSQMMWSRFRGFVKSMLPAHMRQPVGSFVRKVRWAMVPKTRSEIHPAVYDETYLSGMFNERTGEIAPGFSIAASDTVLDVGCGPGMALAFAARRGAEVIGVDMDKVELEKAKNSLEAALARKFELHACNCDDNRLPLPDARVNKVIAQEVMEHVEDPAQFLSELYRVGKPGALYLITVPDPASEGVIRQYAPDFIWEKPYHIHVYGRDEFPQLVQDAGLQIVNVSAWGFYWSMWWVIMWGSEISENVNFGSSQTPALHHWNQTWQALIRTERGRKARKALESLMPKSQIIIARKPG